MDRPKVGAGDIVSGEAQTTQQLAERVLVRVNVGNHDEAKRLLAELVRRADQADRTLRSTPRSADFRWKKVQAQQKRLSKLEGKYATVKGDLRIKQARAEAAEAERDEALRHLGGGEIPSQERIATTHTNLPISWLKPAPGASHSLYRQRHDEACFICSMWNRTEAAEAEAARLREATIRLLSWSDRMPDAGFTDKDARWYWWHDRPADFARAALAGFTAGEKEA